MALPPEQEAIFEAWRDYDLEVRNSAVRAEAKRRRDSLIAAELSKRATAGIPLTVEDVLSHLRDQYRQWRRRSGV